MFVPYPKIHRIGKDEVDGILNTPVYVQEKIDGANLSVRRENDICVWSRTQVICQDGIAQKEFRGAVEYILAHEGIRKFLVDNPTYRLYGERLVKHSISYAPEHYNKFYLFDIAIGDNMLVPWLVYSFAVEYNIETPKLYTQWTLTIDEIMEHVGKNERGVPWEGVVIKSPSFINQFWDFSYAKITTENFREKNNIVFGNYYKDDIEMKISVCCVNDARVMKVINKIEQNEMKQVTIEDTPKVMGLVYYDIFTEELREYAKKNTINFAKLQKNCGNRSRYLFHERLQTWKQSS